MHHIATRDDKLQRRGAQIHDEVEPVGRVDHVMQRDDVRVTKPVENRDLPVWIRTRTRRSLPLSPLFRSSDTLFVPLFPTFDARIRIRTTMLESRSAQQVP